MYGKIYTSFFEGSIMECDMKVRYIFMSMIILSDKDGILDMTEKAIAERVGVEVDDVREAISELMKPDKNSRSENNNGARLVKIRDTFGWQVVNKQYYRSLTMARDRSDYMRAYMRQYRANPTRPRQPLDKKKDKVEKESKEAKPEGNKRGKYDIFMELWNEFAKANNLATIQKLDDKRLFKIKTRLLEKEFDFKKIIEAIPEQGFLLGKNTRGWKVDFDYVVESQHNYIKILERKYNTNYGDSNDDALKAVEQWYDSRNDNHKGIQGTDRESAKDVSEPEDIP